MHRTPQNSRKNWTLCAPDPSERGYREAEDFYGFFAAGDYDVKPVAVEHGVGVAVVAALAEAGAALLVGVVGNDVVTVEMNAVGGEGKD